LKNQAKLETLSEEEKAYLKQPPHALKLRSIDRAFDLELPQLDQEVRQKLKAPIDLANIRNPKHILGLVLTYSITFP